MCEIYLAGNVFYKGEIKGVKFSREDFYSRLNILESFYYIKDWQIELIPKFKNFMLDSGAFSFMTTFKNKKIDWDEYVVKYAEFIKKYDVKYFFELDIDSLVGIKEVERLRNLIEKITNKQVIPVWHKSRGKDYFLSMCKDYKYISIGGLVTKTTMQKEDYKYINWFCAEAHKNDCKIHGLGFTKTNLDEYHFDSVDSTAWTFGNRGKFLYRFNGKRMSKIDMNFKSNRIDAKKVAIHNFNEWVKYSEYLAGYNYKKDIYLAGGGSRPYVIKGE